MNRTFVAAIAIWLASCGPQAQGPAPGTPAERAPSAPAIQPKPVPKVQLTGEYRVAGVDGGDIDQPYAITASITPDRIHVTADCLNFAWTYSIRGDRIATSREAAESCGRGLTAAEEAVVAAFDSAASITRTPANGIDLRGGGRSVSLFSQ